MAAFNFTDDTQLIDIFGPPSYNNFDEPRPITNEPGCLIGFTATFLVLSWIFVCLRLFVRLRIVRIPGWDDIFVFLYLICTTIASICFLCSIKYGTGRHFLFLTVGDTREYLKLFYALNINIDLAAAFIKLSLLCQFLRLFDKGTWMHRASLVGLVLVGIWGFVFCILAIVPCSEIPNAWNIFAQNPHCWGYGSQNPDLFTATFVTHNVLNTFFDLYIIAIPFQLYFQPNVTFKTRMGLMVLLLMGATVVILSIWRVRDTVWYKTGWWPTHDPTWYGPKSILLIVIEVNVASICASVPIFWPVLSPYLGAIFVKHEFAVEFEQRDAELEDGLIMDTILPFKSQEAGLASPNPSKD